MTPALEAELARLRSRHDANPDGRAFAPVADCYRRLGRLDEALDLCLEGLEKHPAYSTAHVILGKIHSDRGEPEAALSAFERVLELDDLNLLARWQCAVLAEDLGRLRLSHQHWSRLLAADPGSSEAEEALERLLASDSSEPADEGVAMESEPDAGAESESEPESRAAAGDAVEPRPTALEARLDGPEPQVEEFGDSDASPREPAESVAPDESAADEEEGEPVQAPDPRAAAARARGIATTTLARIYYEQGFKAKALEVYERVLGEDPYDEELSARVETIRAELAQIESRAAQEPGDAGDILDASLARMPVSPRPTTTPSGGGMEEEIDSDVEALAASIEATDSRDQDYSQFRNWLDRVHDKGDK